MTLSTTYLGFKLPHPLMPGASPLVEDLDMVRRLEDAGSAAIVMHSLFEEQIRGTAGSGGVGDGFPLHPEEYLEHLARVRAAVEVPVIGSLNGTTQGGWIEYARLIETAGADALELNIYELATDAYESGEAVERRLRKMVTRVKEAVAIPVAVKLTPFHTSLAHFARQLGEAGAEGLILFNRFYHGDLDLESRRMESTLCLSDSSELLLRLRWLAILSAHYRGSLAATGGVHKAEDVLKAVICGAHAVQVVSALLTGGPEVLTQLVRDLTQWLEERGLASLSELRGSLNRERPADSGSEERADYMEILRSWKRATAP